jgi:hypothetical protein
MGPEYCQKSYQPWLFYVHRRERLSTSEKAGSADKACRSEAGSLAKAAGSETGSSDRTGGSDTDSSWQASHTGRKFQTRQEVRKSIQFRETKQSDAGSRR